MKPPRIHPLLADVVQTALLACHGIIFDSLSACPACGGKLSGYDRKKKQFVIMHDQGKRIPVHILVNYGLREEALALRRPGPAPTAVLTHGVNPGLVWHFVKQALLDIAMAVGRALDPPTDRRGWAGLARDLGVRVIQIAERDTQVGVTRKAAGEFVNTWSVDGFVGEGCQPSELGWGAHERRLPPDARRHAAGSRAAIYLLRPGASTRVRSWTPLAGPQHGWLITHGESISIADHLTLGRPARPAYRTTVHYGYRPCDDAVLSLGALAGNLPWPGDYVGCVGV